jgi:hypothetical protein
MKLYTDESFRKNLLTHTTFGYNRKNGHFSGILALALILNIIRYIFIRAIDISN